MDRMVVAVVSGILDGLLICAGMFTRNVYALGFGVVFFIIQWKYLER